MQACRVSSRLTSCCLGSPLCMLVLPAGTQLLKVVRLSDLICCFCAGLLQPRAARKMCSAQCWGLCSLETPSQYRMAGRGQVCCPCCLHRSVMAHRLSGNYLLQPSTTPSHASTCMRLSPKTPVGRHLAIPNNLPAQSMHACSESGPTCLVCCQ